MSLPEYHHHHQSLDCGCRRGDMIAAETDFLLQAFLLVAVDSRSGVDMSVHSLMLSPQLFRWRPRLRPPATVPCMMVLERLSCRVTCPNHASLRLFTVARRGSCGPTRSSTLFLTDSLVLWSLHETPSSRLRPLFSNAWTLLSVSARSVHDSQPYRRMDIPAT